MKNIEHKMGRTKHVSLSQIIGEMCTGASITQQIHGF